ncbi:MAG: lysophospholipid acyltransferase family protein [Nanoarchaeota archaeon]|nr:lysophospholipid acyltransferase family protein [Nanoarchaeota archaeon]
MKTRKTIRLKRMRNLKRIHKLLRPYIKNIEGIDNLPKNAAFIAISNHNSAADTVPLHTTIGTLTNKNLCTIVRLVMSREKLLYKLVYNALMKFCNSLTNPISIFEGNVINRCVQNLKKGNILVSFPEGLMNLDTKILLEAKTGTARVALLSKVPIVPIGILNSEKILPPPHSFIPRFHKLTIKIGKPITLRKYYGKEEDKKVLKEVTRILMKEVGKLCNKKYPY